MKVSTRLSKRFQELLDFGNKVIITRQSHRNSPGVVVLAPDYVDSALFEEWATSTISFLGRVMGKDSEHYERFSSHVKTSYFSDAIEALAVLKAARSDYDGGYLFDVRRRIQAEVFDDFLEQADYFLSDGYFQIAAVVAGAVLEDGLRKLSAANGIVLGAQPKLDWMNSELAKQGVYDKLIQKKITWMADIRNKAAHGKWKEFKKEDSAEMVAGVRRLMTDYVSS